MKIERLNDSRTFGEVGIGEVFTEEGGTQVYLRIEVDGKYTCSLSHDGLGVNLDVGEVVWFDDDTKVTILPNAKVIF